MFRKKCVFIILFLISINIYSQGDTIRLVNGSFEDHPRKGKLKQPYGIRYWTDCAPLNNFRKESPPDIHPNGFWEIHLAASDGKTYLGLVTRDNDTYESVSQCLEQPLSEGKCYNITIQLAKSERYISLSRLTSDTTNYSTPVVLRIWGGYTLCQELELLSESIQIDNSGWQSYSFILKPSQTIHYITFAAFYTNDKTIPYCGHLLLDSVSDIVSFECLSD